METKSKSIFSKIVKYSDLVQAMVDGLTKEWVKVDMSTFGEYRVENKKGILGYFSSPKKVCYGCAATNTLCELMGKPFPVDTVGLNYKRAETLNLTRAELTSFELSVDDLRKGHIISSTELFLDYMQWGNSSISESERDAILSIAGKMDLPLMYCKDLEQLNKYQLFATELKNNNL